MSKLTKGQEEIISKAALFLDPKQKIEHIFKIEGSAGTGKTFSLDMIAKMNPEKTVGTAPTHKAVKVLENRVGEFISTGTIHKFLGLKPKREGDSSILIRDRNYDPTQYFDLKTVILDEGSMVGQVLMEFIQKDIEAWGRKYVVSMDGLQLPPVNEKESAFAGSYKFQVSLDEVVRQAKDNPIIQTIQELRKAIIEGKAPELRQNVKKGMGVHLMRKDTWEKKLMEFSKMSKDPDFFRIIAYRNETVHYYNSIVRSMLGMDTSVPFAPGEYVTVKEAFLQNDQVVLNTGEELKVTKMVYHRHPVYPTLEGWEVTCEGKETKFHVLHSVKCAGALKLNLQKVAGECKESGNWNPYYTLKEYWVDLRPPFAITAHQSQGSTFENVFIDYRDIYTNRIKSEADRCLNVALTRPRQNDFVLF